MVKGDDLNDLICTLYTVYYLKFGLVFLQLTLTTFCWIFSLSIFCDQFDGFFCGQARDLKLQEGYVFQTGGDFG